MKAMKDDIPHGFKLVRDPSPPPDHRLVEDPLLSQALRFVGTTLRELANLADAIAMANSFGGNADQLKPSDVQKLLHCSESKARQIVRAHGTGKGKMGRIERGVLMQLQREGKL